MKFSPQIPYLAMAADRKTQKPLLPGQEVELRIGGGKLYDWVQDSVAREMEPSKISKAAIYFVFAISPKSGEQSGGCIRVTDPRNACPFATPKFGSYGSRSALTKLPALMAFAPAGTLINAVARAKETKSEEPPHFKGSASKVPFSSVRSVAGR